MNPLALVGYGKMGKLLDGLAPSFGFEVVARFDSTSPTISLESLNGAKVAIDFSTAAAVPSNIEALAELGVAMVVGTTGWHAEMDRVRQAVDRARGALVYGANFSVGVLAFYDIVAEAARRFAAEEGYDAWAYEGHHRQKRDAPSGTLIELLRTMEHAGYSRPVDVACNRVGYLPGTHRIGFDSEADTITIEHVARSRVGFARGALRAARWVLDHRPERGGVFEFRDVWTETL